MLQLLVRNARLTDGATADIAISDGRIAEIAPKIEAEAERVIDAANPLTLSWTAEDPDGDPLAYFLSYSSDGELWIPLEIGGSAPRFTIDPSQIAVLELVVSSTIRDSAELRSWVDDVLRKMFLNLPGVAAAEVGGGLIREIHIQPDQRRLAGVGLSMQDLIKAIQRANREDPAGNRR